MLPDGARIACSLRDPQGGWRIAAMGPILSDYAGISDAVTGAMWQSIRISELTGDHVTVASDRPCAAAQQLGSAKKNIPARPFFPFTKDGKITDTAYHRIFSGGRAEDQWVAAEVMVDRDFQARWQNKPIVRSQT
jgi:hypothetical protein